MNDIDDLVARLSPDLCEYFEERAGIREYDGGLARDQAECLALLDVLRVDPLALTRVTCLKVERGRSVGHVLAIDAAAATAQLAGMGVTVLSAVDLTTVLLGYQGLALLRTLR